MSNSRFGRDILAAFVLLLITIVLTACGGPKKTQVNVPPPPPLPESQPGIENPPPNSPTQSPATQPPDQDEQIDVPADATVLFEETGLASWYGAPYHNRRGSNGEIYNMHAMTAAHRTLPLGSIVRVTNLKTGRSAVVRITDRGPFIDGRVIDLSQAAAKATDVYVAGVAKVKLETLRVPSPIESGGRWAVQIGAIKKKKDANELAEHLKRRYHTAKVLCFVSPIGDWWVRVRVQDDDRSRAQALTQETKTSEGSVFLVRLD